MNLEVEETTALNVKRSNSTNLANVCQVVSDKNIKGQISKKG